MILRQVYRCDYCGQHSDDADASPRCRILLDGEQVPHTWAFSHLVADASYPAEWPSRWTGTVAWSNWRLA